jgi:hypothetical protein
VYRRRIVPANCELTTRDYKRETSSATISAAGCVRSASATPWPAQSERPSMSPSVPCDGVEDEYRVIGMPSGRRAISCPSPGRLPEGGRPAAYHASTVVLRSARRRAFGQPWSKRSANHSVSVSSARGDQHRVVPGKAPKRLPRLTGSARKAASSGRDCCGDPAEGLWRVDPVGVGVTGTEQVGDERVNRQDDVCAAKQVRAA